MSKRFIGYADMKSKVCVSGTQIGWMSEPRTPILVQQSPDRRPVSTSALLLYQMVRLAQRPCSTPQHLVRI